MREIKFRVWCHIAKKMGYSLNIRTKAKSFWHWIERDVMGSSAYEIMQFTGLFDKNGKEIFEGDIIECWHEGDFNATRQTCHVSYGDGFWQLDFGSQTFPFGDEKFSEFEVIGNIYENPELLNSAYENDKTGA